MVEKSLKSLLKHYFFNRRQIPVWLMLAFVVAASAVNVRLSVELNTWNGQFYNALQKVDVPKIYDALGDFVVLVAAIVVVIVCAAYVRKRCELVMRRDLTFLMFEQWLSKDSMMYRLRESIHEPDNPDQRIAEDIRDLVDLSVSLSLSLFSSVLTIGSFSVILWNLSGSISVFGVDIPGYMFWVCLIYTAVETLVTHLLGRRLKHLNYEGQHREADLRTSLIEKRLYADAIAGVHGEHADKTSLKKKFNDLMGLLVQKIKTERNMDFFTVSLNQVTSLTPIFFALPSLFAGTIQLGGLIQIRQAFVRVDRSLSWFARFYGSLARLMATYDRLSRLQHRIAQVEQARKALSDRIDQTTEGLDADIAIRIPNRNRNRPLNVTMTVNPGEFVALTGASGLGKSTLLRTFAGFNDQFEGKLARTSSFMWLPQKGYLFKASLMANITYPSLPDAFGEAQVTSVLKDVGLEYLINSLHEERQWDDCLSGGEQQRVLLTRALLHQPKLLMIDEMTSALDSASAHRMVRLLKERLPQTAILFITHQEEVRGEAHRTYSMNDYYVA